MASSSSTRASLLSRVRDPADDRAWREFSDQYGELILRYARGRGLQQSDAEDVRQLVLVSLSQSLRANGFRYNPEKGRFRDYLGAAVRHEVGRFFSRHARDPGALSGDGVVEASRGGEGPDALWEREWADHHYRRAMRIIRETFEPRSVEVFDRLLAGLRAGDAAAAFGMTEEGVRKIKQRILDRLKELIREQVRQEDAPDG